MEKWIRSEEIYKGDILSLQVGDVKLENGEVFRREVIRHNGGVAIVPVINNSIFLIRQFRIAIERDILELPAGKLEIGESPEACAHRELGEEIGYRAGKMIFATSFYTSVGFSNEILHIFLAFQLKQVKQHLDPDESISLVRIPIVEIEEQLAKKEFEDAKTIIGLRELLAYLK